MTTPPTGTVTFLFTDIEGSTRLAQQFPIAWPAAQSRHHAILQGAIESHGGHVFQIIGDAFCAAFHTPSDALAATIDGQHALQAEPWGNAIVRVRMGLHTGAASARPGGDYEGYLTLARAQRIMSGAYGGQVLMSQDVADLVGRDLPAGVGLRDLGRHRLKDLSVPEHLYQLIVSGLPADFAPLKTADRPNNLPTQLTSFIGREAEIAEVRRLLAGTRLLTLSGAGGVGKTRLALQVAAEEQTAFSDGVWFVELAPLADPAVIPSTIASAVGVREEPNRPILSTLGDHIRAKSVLIVLDNCEHLIADTAQVCDTLLHAAPHLKVIATSREALGISGETSYRVPSLGVPGNDMAIDSLSHVPSVRLFSERARAAKTDFALTRANALAVAQVCWRLDGIPLAIELAAARIKALSPEQIATRLDDRFRILTGGSRTAMPRQQTLRATVDWSYSLLTEPERVLLRRLSVFAGGWTLEAAEAVCADPVGAKHSDESSNASPLRETDILDQMAHLADKSLVMVETMGDAVRYRMLETVRQYAREKLFDSDLGAIVRDRHLRYFVHYGRVAEPKLRSIEMADWIKRLDADADNMRAALDWSLETRQAEAGLQLAIETYWYWIFHGHQAEQLHRLTRLLSALSTNRQALTYANALMAVGSLYLRMGNFPQATTELTRALGIAQEIGDMRTITDAQMHLANAKVEEGSYAEAEALYQGALDHADIVGDPRDVSIIKLFMAHLSHLQHNFGRAYQLYAEGFALQQQSGNPNVRAYHLRMWAYTLLDQGRADEAKAKFLESLKINLEIGDQQAITACMSALASALFAIGKHERATKLLGAAEALSALIQTWPMPYDHLRYMKQVAAARQEAGDPVFCKWLASGRSMTYDQAIAYALEGGDA